MTKTALAMALGDENQGKGVEEKKKRKISHREENEKLQYILSQQTGLSYSLWVESEEK